MSRGRWRRQAEASLLRAQTARLQKAEKGLALACGLPCLRTVLRHEMDLQRELAALNVEMRRKQRRR
jgi:hypothetical protein